MKIKRYFAVDMRQAIKAVREEQGPDAVILSNQRVDNGIEIIAAVDYDESLMHQAVGRVGDGADKALAIRAHETPKAEPSPEQSPVAVAAEGGSLDGMRHELNGLRQMLECRFSSLAWNDMARREPVQAAVLRDLTRIGLSASLARRLVADMPAATDPKKVWRFPLAMLAKRLPMARHSMMEKGGIIAMVGPTGVGKTTSIAKLAARFALRHGHRNVALVTTDGFRIGAQEQLFTFGRILGVPVYVANDALELNDVLSRVEDKKLILIDTAGVSHRDLRLAEQFRTLSTRNGYIETCLVLAANAEPGNLDQVAKAYMPFKPSYCIATKLDETASLGGILSVAIERHLPLAYISNGQRVPEDIKPASGPNLVCEAVKCIKATPRKVDEGMMAQRFGAQAVAHA